MTRVPAERIPLNVDAVVDYAGPDIPGLPRLAGAMASPSEAPNLAYAAVYPTAMIAKIVLAQLLVAWVGG